MAIRLQFAENELKFPKSEAWRLGAAQEFLHREGLEWYRVLSEQGAVTVEPDNTKPPDEQHEEKTKGVPPFPPFSRQRLPLMDLVYPNYSSRGYGYKKTKP